jgi:hypothetical protein
MMDTLNLLAVLLIVLITAVLMFLFARRLQAGEQVGLRPLASYTAVATQVGRAVESGRRVHVALGRASLIGPATPTSVAALKALDRLAEDACASGVPPLVTVGEGTLLPAAQDSLRQAYSRAGRAEEFSLGAAQLLAAETFPMTYAAGVTEVIHRGGVGSNLMVGRFGPEIGIIVEAAARAKVDQIIGSDDPVALSIGATVTDNLLIGEELLASAAYLEGQPAQIASLQVQDILRFLVIGAIIIVALVQLVIG